MKYIHFIYKYDFISGAHLYLKYLIQNQSAAGHQVLVCSYEDLTISDISYKIEQEGNNFTLLRLYKKHSWFDKIAYIAPKEIEILEEIFRKFGKFEIGFLNIWGGPLNLAVSKICKKYISKVILIEHTHYSLCLKNWLFDDDNAICNIKELPEKCNNCSVYLDLSTELKSNASYIVNLRHKNISNLLGNFIDEIQSPSYHLIDDLLYRFPYIKEKTYKINIEPIFSYVSGDLFHQEQSEYIFGFIGRIDELKGFLFLHDTLQYINSRKINVLYVFSGNKIENPFGSQQVNYTYDIHWNISNQEVYKLFYSKVKYVIFPSLWKENYPVVCIESKNYNKNIIAHNIPGAKEVLSGYEKAEFYDSSEQLQEIIISKLI